MALSVEELGAKLLGEVEEGVLDEVRYSTNTLC